LTAGVMITSRISMVRAASVRKREALGLGASSSSVHDTRRRSEELVDPLMWAPIGGAITLVWLQGNAHEDWGLQAA
ncbi:MAG: hypothetical protein WAK67_18220, partial [Xanthobacteraceae bacterium]